MRGQTRMFIDTNRSIKRICQSRSVSTVLRMAVIAGSIGNAGCTTFASPNPLLSDSATGITLSDQGGSTSNEVISARSTETAENRIEPIEQVMQVSSDQPNETPNPLTLTEKSQHFFNRLSGKQQENSEQAQQWYQRANRDFEIAAKQPREQAKVTFEGAAELFEYAGKLSVGSALQQDAMFMQGESLFFADRLVAASDVYERLQKDFPRNRHIDKVAARLFSISQYWIEVAKVKEGNWSSVNLTDPKYPRLDVDGHAIRVLDQIRFDDPTGRLADDATLAAAVEYVRQGKFQEADEFLLDLRETFSDSEHLFIAHMLGITVKLQTYRGPKYSGLALEEAEKLVEQTRQRFPDKLASTEDDFGQRLEQSAAKIAFLQAERLRYRAEYREKRKEFGAARYYYNQLLTKYPETPHADNARERLEATDKKPRKPAQRLSWLTTIFPDSTAHEAPLELNRPAEGGSESGKTLLR